MEHALGNILRAVPEAYLVLIAEAFDTNDLLWKRFKQTLTNYPRTSHRVVFAPYNRYVHLVQQAACVLDTFPYGGCLTAHDAISESVPMPTLPSEHVRGRYTLAMYKQMGHMDLVAHNESHFVDIAVRLLSDPLYQRQQSEAIERAYLEKFHRNDQVLSEWFGFLNTLFV